MSRLNSIELFAGAGGLALGTSRAGFKHEAVIEWNADACKTIRANQYRRVAQVRDWPLIQGDVHKLSFQKWEDKIDLVAGGPPCQPFSIGGKHGGFADDRNYLRYRAVRETRPKAFVFENVKGLLRASFVEYFEYIILQLSYPEIVLRNGEDWMTHLGRLERYHTRGKIQGLNYRVAFRLLNAADYGVPQKRERVFIVGFRSDIGRAWSFPDPTHSRATLTASKAFGDYWERHRVPLRLRQQATFCNSTFPGPDDKLPWQTARDAISDLPEPTTIATVLKHIHQSGASLPGPHGKSVRRCRKNP